MNPVVPLKKRKTLMVMLWC